MNLLPWWGRHRDPIDLTNSSDFTLELLDRTWDWRTRLSEEFELGSGEHARVVSRYEIEITRSLIESFPGGSEASRVKALLPVTTRENRPFLNFSIIGPGDSPAHLMRRSAIAAIESEALARYVIGSSVSDLPKLRRGLSDNLLEAVCVFMPQVFQEYEAMNPKSFERALAEYLTDGLSFPVNRTDVVGWMGPSREAGDILREALDEPEMRHSSAELILLAIPRMDPLPQSVHEIGRVVAGFRDSIQMAHEAGDIDLLSVLAEYGRRWEVIIETEVPIDEPATIRLIEDRPLGLEDRPLVLQP